jgi:cupin fold WbuC family metalloprotein
MPFHEISPEVLTAVDDLVQIASPDVAGLGRRAKESLRKRSRLCAHRDPADALHEMFVCLHRDTYIRPHRHPGKVESFHIIQGEVEVLIFDDEGIVRQVVSLGEVSSRKPFYYRLSVPAFHSVLPRTQLVYFHETTNGPFRQGDTIFADWAPPESEPAAASSYLAKLREFLEERAAA